MTRCRLLNPYEWTRWLIGSDPWYGMFAVRHLLAIIADWEKVHIARARGAGYSWDRIATCLGISPQAAHKKFRLMQAMGHPRIEVYCSALFCSEHKLKDRPRRGVARSARGT